MSQSLQEKVRILKLDKNIQIKIDDIIYGVGVAHSKKEAEQEAAKNALEKSVKNP